MYILLRRQVFWEVSVQHSLELQYIGRCYEYGWLGKPVDLHKASEYYSMAIHEPGGPEDETFLKHVRELNEKLYGNSPSSPETRMSFFQRLKFIFKK